MTEQLDKEKLLNWLERLAPLLQKKSENVVQAIIYLINEGDFDVD